MLPKIIKCRFNYYRKLQCRLYEAYGNEQNITPFLDSQATKFTFTNFMLQEIEQCGFRSRNLMLPTYSWRKHRKREDNKTNFQREAF
jgi:hypothetical protein